MALKKKLVLQSKNGLDKICACKIKKKEVAQFTSFKKVKVSL